MVQYPPASPHRRQPRRAIAIAQTTAADQAWAWRIAFLLGGIAWAAVALLIKAIV